MHGIHRYHEFVGRHGLNAAAASSMYCESVEPLVDGLPTQISPRFLSQAFVWLGLSGVIGFWDGVRSTKVAERKYAVRCAELM